MVRAISVLSQIKKNQLTVKGTDVQNTLTTLHSTKKQHTDTKEWGLRSLCPKPRWQAHFWPTATCVSKHEELWAILQHANARAGSNTEFQQGVCTEYTPVACIMNTTVFSQAQITYVLVAQGSSSRPWRLKSHCIIFVRLERIRHLVSHVISLLVSASPPLFQSTTTRSTTWTARPSARRHCTPSTYCRTFSVDKQR